MKVTRIEVEGEKGGAYLERRVVDAAAGRRVAIVCQDTWGKRHFYREAGIRDEAEQAAMARLLQANLDGCRGTAGDIAEYRRVIEFLAA